LGVRGFGIHELHGHVSITGVNQHAFRLRDGYWPPIRSRSVDAHQRPRSDQLFPC
jgi:hypothetical protein